MPPAQVNIPRGPRTSILAPLPRGNVPVPSDKGPIPGAPPAKTPMTTLLVRDPSKDVAPPMVVTTLVPLPTALQPLPGRPYCADARLAGTELCAGAPVSDECARVLGAWLAANPGTPLAAFLASSSAMGELCAGEFVRLLAPAGTKASAGFYDAPGYGNPFGIDGYAWKQDRVRKPAPFSYRGDGSTMDWRKPSGALPNYHRAPYGFRPSGLVYDSHGYTAEEQANAAGAGFTAADLRAFNESTAGQSLYRQELAQAAAAAPPATPPVDYAALVAGIGSAVGASLSGIGTIVNQANQNRLRELEIEYANNARGAQLALQRATMEAQTEIQRLAAQNTPAANAAVQALQQQVADMSVRLQQPPASEWTTGEKIGAAAAGVAVLGFAAWLATRKG